MLSTISILLATILDDSDFGKENILKVQEDHCQDPNAIPLTQEEISNLVFKKKSGIVKGLGMRPSSSLVTTASSNSSVEYIQQLENEILELKDVRAREQEERAREQEERARDQEERARDQEARVKQEEIQKNILNFLRSVSGGLRGRSLATPFRSFAFRRSEAGIGAHRRSVCRRQLRRRRVPEEQEDRGDPCDESASQVRALWWICGVRRLGYGEH
ncbi:hypothetical protein SO802_032047 [Lithocarpus litseifolius]|uniref:Uncharacterized protein n=1 Tax=Lithocarpus litseifolius TaxID=425828 RepID=A0AAW2BMA3_9ROSI